MFGHSPSELRDAIAEALVDAERRHGVRLRFITDVVRNVPFKWADRTLEWALEMQGRGVVALGLSGFEATHGNEPFVEHFRAAAAAGLHCVAHAGEHAGPASIRSVRELCGAERIGHGVRAVEDPELVAELAAEGVPLEVCPSSNVRLGVVPDLASHPFDRLRAAGVTVTVNSDDPPLFATTLDRRVPPPRRDLRLRRRDLRRAVAGGAPRVVPPGRREGGARARLPRRAGYPRRGAAGPPYRAGGGGAARAARGGGIGGGRRLNRAIAIAYLHRLRFDHRRR